ncbi:HAD-IIIA family hydrolase [bacterium]|nr:HAD-IIIA family hydrolase [bacterium]
MISEKIKKREQLVPICEVFRKQGKKIGFTSGAFDLMHAGHADYLEKAKAMCDVLIVGVNTDDSVRSYKGPGRPFVPEDQRIRLVAALESVDFAFLFGERRNQKNIEALKPDFYIKAGDYDAGSLTSKETVEQHGGEVRIIPMLPGVSTTALAEKIAGSASSRERFREEEGAAHIERRPAKTAPALFLDRDGTINEEILYLHDVKELRILPNAIPGIKKFQDMGYRIVIISNQPGIGMGYYSKQDFYRINREILKSLSSAGILVDKIYFCPHSKSEKCECRKPGQALVQRAKEELNLDLSRSVFIGDKTSDMETGRRAGMKTVLVRSGFRGEDGEFPGEPDFRADDILDAAGQVLGAERRAEGGR